MHDESFNIKVTTKKKSGTPKGLPDFLLREMKEKILGKRYELSVVFVGRTRIRTLNRVYRNKDKATDVLSFPNTKNSGEIFMCLEKARAKAKKFDRIPDQHVAFLFIHGLLHLKGMVHGSRMEAEEKQYSSYFGVDTLSHNSKWQKKSLSA